MVWVEDEPSGTDNNRFFTTFTYNEWNNIRLENQTIEIKICSIQKTFTLYAWLQSEFP